MSAEISNTTARRRRAMLGVLLIAPIVLVFGAAETWVRLTRPDTDLWALTGRKIGKSPNAAWALTDAFCAYRFRPGHFGTIKTVNSLGFISTPEITVAKPTNTFRIVFLGESSTAGTGRDLADRDTWPRQVAEMLTRKLGNASVEYVNGAVDGYTSFESCGRLWSRLRFFNPDAVVVYHGWNEMYYFSRVDELHQWKTLPDGSWAVDRDDKLRQQYKPLTIDYLIRPSQLLTRLRIRVSKGASGEFGGSAKLATGYDRRGIEIFRTNLRLMRDVAKSLGMEFYVVKQATLIVPNLPIEHRSICRYEFHGFDHDAHVDAFNRIYRVIEDEIPAERIIDATAISGKVPYFYDHIHPTPQGAKEIARMVANGLEPFLRSKLRSGK